MYVCMYVCMYVRMYVRMYVCMYVCTQLLGNSFAVSHPGSGSSVHPLHVDVFQGGRVHCGQRQVPFRSSSVSFAAQYFMLLVTLLQTNQSVEMLHHIFAFIRCFIHKVSPMYMLLCSVLYQILYYVILYYVIHCVLYCTNFVLIYYD